jgi:hypothetical protein
MFSKGTFIDYLGSGLAMGTKVGFGLSGSDYAQNTKVGFERPPKQDAADSSLLPIDGIASTPELPQVTPYTAPLPAQKTKPRITGFSNQDGRGKPDPCCFGENKYYPIKAARDLTETRGGAQYLTCLFNLGYGPLELDSSKIWIGEKLIDKYDDVEYELLPGTTSDPPQTLYTADVESDTYDDELILNKAQIKPTGQSAVKIVVEFVMPNGLYDNETITNEDGTSETTQVSNHVDVKVEYRLANTADAWTNAGFMSKTANSNVPVYGSRTIRNLTKALYEIRVTKTTADGAENEVRLLQIRAYGDSKPFNNRTDSAGNPVGTALLAVTVKAQDELNGQIASLSVQPKRKLEHFNGTTWDAAAATSNPADIYVEALCGQWTAEPLDRATQIDTASIYAWSQFCVANGFTFNFVYDEQVELLDVLKQICAVGRASPALINGKAGVIIDDVKTTVSQVFTPANIIKGSFEGQATWTEDPDVIDVQFVSPLDQWQQSQRPVYADGKDSTNAHKRQSLPIIGVTDKDHAWKLTRYFMAVGRLRREKFIFSVGFEYLRCQRGDKVWLSHDAALMGLGGSRIKALVTNGGGDITAVKLYDTFGMDLGVDYDISFRLADGSVISRVTAGDGNVKDTFVFTVPILNAVSPKPEVNDLCSIGGYTECLIEGIETTEDLTARITVVPYAPGVFTAATGPIPPYTPLIVEIDDAVNLVAPPVIYSIRSDESVLYRDTDGSLVTRIAVTLRPPEYSVVAFETQIRRSGSDDWQETASSPAVSNTVFIYGVEDGALYDIQIRAVTRLGLKSGWATELEHFVIGKTTKPPDIPNVQLDIRNSLLRIFYDSRYGVERPLDFAGFQVRMQRGRSGNPNESIYWESAEIISQLFTDDTFDISGFAANIKTFLIKAVDTSGNLSVNPYIVQWDFGAVEVGNYIERYPLQNNNYADCTLTNMTPSGGILTANVIGLGDAGPFYEGDESDPAPHVGLDSDIFWNNNYYQGIAEWDYAPPAIPSGLLKVLLTITAERYTLEYRTQLDELFYGDPQIVDTVQFPYYSGADADPFWQPELGFTPWLPFPDEGIPCRRQKYQFRLVTAASRQQATISSLIMVVDGPTEEMIVSNIKITAPGTRFSVAPIDVLIGVFPQVQGSPTYPSAFLAFAADLDVAQGPLIQVFDAAGNLVDGLVSIYVKGYQNS